jgi:hypothetical protein
VLGEAAYKTLGARDMQIVFPQSGLQRRNFLNILQV